MKRTGIITAAALAIAAVIFLCAADTGSSWKVVQKLSTTPGDKGASGLQVNFLDESVGSALRNGNRFFHTVDGGKNWSELRIDTMPCLRGPSVLDANVVAVGCDCSDARVSTDAGKSWTKVNGINSYPMASMFDASTGFFAKKGAIGRKNLISRVSKDSDKPEKVATPDGMGILMAICAFSAKGCAALDGSGTVYVTENAGQSWQKANQIAYENKSLVYRDSLTSMSFKNAKEGMVVTFDSDAEEWNVISTKDGGKTWSAEVVLKGSIGSSAISRGMDVITLTPAAADTDGIIILKKI